LSGGKASQNQVERQVKIQAERQVKKSGIVVYPRLSLTFKIVLNQGMILAAFWEMRKQS
jgi:hypothetical protein